MTTGENPSFINMHKHMCTAYAGLAHALISIGHGYANSVTGGERKKIRNCILSNYIRQNTPSEEESHLLLGAQIIRYINRRSYSQLFCSKKR